MRSGTSKSAVGLTAASAPACSPRVATYPLITPDPSRISWLASLFPFAARVVTIGMKKRPMWGFSRSAFAAEARSPPDGWSIERGCEWITPLYSSPVARSMRGASAHIRAEIV